MEGFKTGFTRWKVANILFADMFVLQLLVINDTFPAFTEHEV
jgi:hypothetical protein